MAKPDPKLISRQRRRLKQLPIELVYCRVGGDRHWWEARQPDWSPTNSALPEAHQCLRCKAIKRVEISPRYGEMLKYSIEYPENYLIKRVKDDGPDRLVSTQAVRLELHAARAGQELPPIEPL